MTRRNVRPFRIPRRALLRGAGAATLALPVLDIMSPAPGYAQEAVQRFFAFFYPNGREPGKWNVTGAISPDSLPECLQDLTGFDAEGVWPAYSSVVDDIALVHGIKHTAIAPDIHDPSMALSAHGHDNHQARAASIDQYLADYIAGDTPYRALTVSATDDRDVSQGHISWRGAGEVVTPERSPRALFDTLFGGGDIDDSAAQQARLRQESLLDYVLEDATRLRSRLGVADAQRVDQYLTSVSELETQVGATSTGCAAPEEPASNGNWHTASKLFMDMTVAAMACDLTRVVSLQYSNSWGVHYGDYPMGEGLDALGDWSDHFISHKVGDDDRATDLDGVANAFEIATRRVILATRFKVRRFANLVEALKNVSTPTGTLYDETLALYVSENGDGDNHSREDMGYFLAGGVGGFQKAYGVNGGGKPTGALHASIIRLFGLPVDEYGDPASTALDDI